MKYGNGESCENCKFSVKPAQLPGIDYSGKFVVGDDSDLICHRHPPKPVYDLKKRRLVVAVGRP